jgi:hypothetical protein
MTITCEQAIVTVESPHPRDTWPTGYQVAAKVETDLVEDAKDGKTDQVTHHATPQHGDRLPEAALQLTLDIGKRCPEQISLLKIEVLTFDKDTNDRLHGREKYPISGR